MNGFAVFGAVIYVTFRIVVITLAICVLICAFVLAGVLYPFPRTRAYAGDLADRAWTVVERALGT